MQITPPSIRQRGREWKNRDDIHHRVLNDRAWKIFSCKGFPHSYEVVAPPKSNSSDKVSGGCRCAALLFRSRVHRDAEAVAHGLSTGRERGWKKMRMLEPAGRGAPLHCVRRAWSDWMAAGGRGGKERKRGRSQGLVRTLTAVIVWVTSQLSSNSAPSPRFLPPSNSYLTVRLNTGLFVILTYTHYNKNISPSFFAHEKPKDFSHHISFKEELFHMAVKVLRKYPPLTETTNSSILNSRITMLLTTNFQSMKGWNPTLILEIRRF